MFAPPRPGYVTWQIYVDGLKRLIVHLSATAVDPTYQFVFAHINVPHEAFVFDAGKDEFAKSMPPDKGYSGNLELADWILSKIQTAMNNANPWDETNVIITSDHWWRENIYDGIIDKWRVPFIVKLEGQRRQVMFADEIKTVGLRHLVRRILDGTLQTPEGIPQALIGGRQ